MVYNGEVFNHPELRKELEARGERFRTTSDTEILLRLIDRDGPAALDACNGQWAIAHVDRPSRTLTLMRDRFGVRPLHYALLPDGGIVFSSEVKGILASGLVDATPDLEGIDEVFTLWAARPPRSAFEGIRLLPPGHLLVWRDGEIVEQRPWWEPRYATDAPAPAPEALGELLRDSVRLRLRSDVPVGCYLSGGLDSSLTTALAVEQTEHQLRTFSLAFRDPLFDESAFQRQVAEELGTQHHVIEIGPEEITDAFQDVMRHVETPVIRSAGVPLYLLAQSTREQGITVVATGEGADELYWGYDLFKEAKVRAFCARAPDAAWRASLFDRMYPYFASSGGRRGESWRRFFLDAGPASDPLFSHQTRIQATSGVKSLYSGDTRAALAGVDPLERLRDDLPEEFGRMSVLERAAYLELTTLLGNHLLAAQADRVGMAHGIEGRFPFLDHRVFEHSVATRPQDKLAGLHEKIAIRRVAAEVVPPIVAQRPKQPYRAPEAAAFFANEPEWVTERLSAEAVRAVGIYDERAVAGLVRRCRAGRATGFRENMALMGVLSTQVWHETFCTGGMRFPEEDIEPRVRLELDLPVRVGSAA
jgi:asparagine synthase (glutamine-hydrolysing)